MSDDPKPTDIYQAKDIALAQYGAYLALVKLLHDRNLVDTAALSALIEGLANGQSDPKSGTARALRQIARAIKLP